MTVTNTSNRIQYTGNGSTTAFAVAFPFHDKADLIVIETIIATGAETTKVITTDYTISGTADALGHYPNGGSVDAITAPASTVTWTIYRDPTLTQSVDVTEGGPLPVESALEAPLDRAMMVSQRIRELVTRALRQPEGDSTDIEVMPGKVDRASKILGFNSSGDPVVLSQLDQSAQTVLSTGSTTARTLAERFSEVVNVKDYGAIGDGVANDTAAIQSAIDAAAVNGGTVFIPQGFYQIHSTIKVPAKTNVSVHIVGATQANTTLNANNAAADPVIRFGGGSSGERDASGSSTYNTTDDSLERMTISTSSFTGITLIELIQTQRFIMRDVFIQGASGSGGIGLSLLGSTTTGLGSASAPQVLRNKFYNIVTNDCRKPLYMENVEESDFYSCTFDMTQTITAGSNTLFAIQQNQGANNRFFGTLLTGDTNATYRGAYVGFKADTAVDGINQTAQFYGILVEGFNRGIWIEGTNNSGFTFIGYDGVSNATEYVNVSGTNTPANGFVFWGPISREFEINQPSPYAPLLALTYSTSIDTNASQANVFQIVISDGVAFTIENPTSGKQGQNITYDIRNSSGGAMGVLTWASDFKLAGAFTNPADTKRRTITYFYDDANWVELNRATADI